MSLVQLRVEVPTYSHSFTIQVPDICTIHDVKQEIFNTCPGSPQVSGQRIIWRGRYLSDDEKLADIWKSNDDPKIIHLSVHPSAWTSKPPGASSSEQSQRQSASPSMRPSLSNTSRLSQTTRLSPARSFPFAELQNPLSYVLHKHKQALSILMKDRSFYSGPGFDMEALRINAKDLVESHGLEWPSILDEPFPSTADAGVVYERTEIDGKMYLRLRNPNDKPNEAQIHALKVLSFTFPLLKLPTTAPPPTAVPHSGPVAIPPHLHGMIQQILTGLPQADLDARPQILEQLQGQQGLNGVERVIEININLRALVLPLFMLAFRTLLLLYFVAPTRKPVFGILIVTWVLYEIWQAMRGGILGAQRDRADQQDRQEGNAGAAGAGPRNQNQPAANAAAPGRPQQQPPRPRGNTPTPVLDSIASYDIQEEEAALTQGDVVEPTLTRKAITFVTLFFATVHPAIWNRRRAALRQREGRIRTEERARSAPPAEEGNAEESETATARRETETRERLQAQHERRRPWIQRYVQRVVRGEWVDDSD